jgi:parvulin-like peptidyl-prolyl isomerase
MVKKKKIPKSKSTKKTNKKTSKPKAAKKSKSKKSLVITLVVIILIALGVYGWIQLSAIKNSNVITFVNNDKITQEELDRGYEFLFFITGYPEEYKQIITKEAFLEQLINEKIVLQEAKKEGIEISDGEVEAKINEMMNQNLLGPEEFESRLDDKGFSLDYFKNYYKTQLILSKFLNESLFSQIELTDSEIRSYYEINKDSFRAKEGEIRARHILVETREEALDILKELRKGADFAELAKEESIGPSAVRGGDLGFFGRESMVKEFEDEAFALRIGEVSDPVQTDYGWHVIKREHDIMPYSETEESIRTLLLVEKQKEIFKDYLDDLKTDSKIIINLDGVEMSANPLTAVDNTCRDNNGISTDTVIFYHADWCPHCQRMVPVVEDLESEGYNFLWAETSTNEGSVAKQCFGDVIQGGVPQFICAGTNDYELGEMSKSELRDFADRCQS